MNVQSINGTNFESRNTFLTRAKNARNDIEKKYWKSLYYEAKARLSSQKFENAEKNIFKISDTGSIVGVIAFSTALSIMGFRKLQSIIYNIKSHSLFPNRFIEPDDYNVKDARYYEKKENCKI